MNHFIKNTVLIIIILLCNQKTYSHSSDSSIYNENYNVLINNFIGNISTNEITTNYFLDKSPPLFNPDMYSGSINDSNSVDKYCWWRAYATYQLSEINDILPASEDLINSIDHIAVQNESAIPILLLFNEYERLKSTAISDNLIYFDGNSIHDVPNRTNTPFIKNTSFVGTVSEVLFQNTQLKFVFKNEFFITNLAENIDKAEINFDDGNGFVELIDNNVYDINYETDGKKHIIYKITTIGGEFLSHSYINISRPYAFSTSNVSFYTESLKKYLGESGVAKVDIVYGCGHDKLIKPLIIVEGIDPPENTVLGYPNHDYIFAINYLRSSQPLMDTLKLEDYDLVIIDFAHGADYIQRNAYVVERVIDYVNTVKYNNGSTEKNAIIGYSMGGVVARYALRDMELSNLNHDTRLFISFDSPQLGANNPISVQHLGDHTKKIIDRLCSNWLTGKAGAALSIGVRQVNAAYSAQHGPASRQLTIYQSHGAYDEYSNSILYDAFMNELNVSMGMPLNCRNVTIVNGSGTGNNISNFNAGDIILDVYSNNTLFSSFGYEKFGLALLNVAGTGITHHSVLKAIPSTYIQNHKVYSGHFKFSILFIPIIDDEKNKYTESYFKPYDNCPGSYFELTLVNSSGSIPVGVNSAINYFTFIPSVSSVLLKSPERDNLDYNLISNNIVSSNKTPFNGYISATYNTGDLYDFYNRSHVTVLPNENDLFILDELHSNIKRRFNQNLFNTTNISFNFTNYFSDRLNSTNINQGSVLKFNCNAPSGFINSGLSSPQPNSNIEVYTYTCDDIVINNNFGGNIIIGDNTINTTAILHITQDSKLYLKSGSTLTINNNSKLVIEKGAELIIESGAILNLVGSNSILELFGKIIIADETQFSKMGSGYIRFKNSTESQIILGMNSKFIYNGNGISDKIFELDGCQAKIISNSNGELLLSNTYLHFLNQGKLIVDCKLNLTYSKLSGVYNPNNSNDNGYGLVVYGQKELIINNCEFSNTTVGIEAYLAYTNNLTFAIQECTFHDNMYGVKSDGRGFIIENSNFENNSYHVYSTNLNLSSSITNSNFLNYALTAMTFSGSPLSTILLDNVHIIPSISGYNISGIEVFYTNINIKCSDIYGFNKAVRLSQGATLDASNANEDNYGNNTFSIDENAIYNSAVFELTGANQLFMDYGYNKLRKPENNSEANYYYVKGSLSSIGKTIEAKYNYWYPDYFTTTNTLPTASEFNLDVKTKISYNPIAPSGVYDNFCLSSSFRVADPCQNPNDCPNSSINLINNCAECNSVLINGKALNVKLKNVIKEIRLDTLNVNTINHIAKLDSIINKSYAGKKVKLELIKEIAILQLLKQYNVLINSNYNLDSTNQSKLISILDNRINYYLVNGKSDLASYLYLTKANYYLSVNNFELSKLNFDFALNNAIVNSELNSQIEFQKCLANVKELFVLNLIDDSTRVQMMSSCQDLLSENNASNKLQNNSESISQKINIKVKNVIVKPNPASDHLNVDFVDFSNDVISLKIYDIFGREIFTKNLNESIRNKIETERVDLTNFPEGIYIIVIKNQDFLSYNKFIVE